MNSFTSQHNSAHTPRRIPMPKIIENLRSTLIEEAKYQVNKFGYAGMTIKSVSKACNIGVGTVYNYFKSKEELVFAFMYEEWLESIAVMRKCSEETDSPEVLFRCIHSEIGNYTKEHQRLITDKNAAKVFSVHYFSGHEFLRVQIEEIIAPVCMPLAKNPSPLLCSFMAEMLLIWSATSADFDEIYAVLKDHFKE